MTSDKKQRRRLLTALEATRTRHAEVLQKLAKARSKVERFSQKLHKLEAKLYELEQRLHAPDMERLGQAAAGDVALRPVRLILNLHAGSVDHNPEVVEAISKSLRAHGFLPDVDDVKTSGKAARQLAEEAVANKEDMVIVAGGDGTIEDVALKLVGSETRLGILPVGTANNLARSLGIPLDLEDACALLGMGAARAVDVGRVIVEDSSESKLFLETGGVGLTAIMVPAGQAIHTQPWSELSKFIRKVLDVHPEPLAIELDTGQVVVANSQVVTVSNSPLAATNVLLAPDAKMDDGLLDVTIYDDMSRTDVLAYFLSASHGEPVDDPNVRRYQSKTVVIRSEQPIAAHADKSLPRGRPRLPL